jgi:hypothetical protein
MNESGNRCRGTLFLLRKEASLGAPYLIVPLVHGRITKATYGDLTSRVNQKLHFTTSFLSPKEVEILYST